MVKCIRDSAHRTQSGRKGGALAQTFPIGFGLQPRPTALGSCRLAPSQLTRLSSRPFCFSIYCINVCSRTSIGYRRSASSGPPPDPVIQRSGNTRRHPAGRGGEHDRGACSSARHGAASAPARATKKHPCCVPYSSFALNIVCGRSSMRGLVVCLSGATTRCNDSATGKHLGPRIRGNTSRTKLCRKGVAAPASTPPFRLEPPP